MKKTIVIADDNTSFSLSIFDFFNNTNDSFNVIGIAKDGIETLDLVNKYNPDFLILDLDMPNKSGLEVLEEIENKKYYQTTIIVVSGQISMINYLNIINHKKISNIFIKPFNISTLYLAIKNISSNDDIEIETIIDNVLHQFSFNFSSHFYNYLLITIKKSLHKPFILNEIYKEIAIEQNTTFNKVKWGMEKFISSMVRYTPTNILTKYIPYNNKPSPKVFIYEMIIIVKKQIEINS